MAERVTVPPFNCYGRQLAAGEAPALKRAEVASNVGRNANGAPLDKPQARPPRPCARCGRRFKPTRKRWLLCAGCFKSADASMES